MYRKNKEKKCYIYFLKKKEIFLRTKYFRENYWKRQEKNVEKKKTKYPSTFCVTKNLRNKRTKPYLRRKRTDNSLNTKEYKE